MPMTPHRKASKVSTVWSLSRITGKHRHILGQYSTDGLAAKQAELIIHLEAGIRQIRLPAWLVTPEGCKELVYGRDAQSWRFQIEAWPIDGEAQ